MTCEDKRRKAPSFDPDAPIERPPSGELVDPGQFWTGEQLARFEVAAAEGLRPRRAFAAAVTADELLRRPAALDTLARAGCDELQIDFRTLGPAGDPRAAQLARLVDAAHRRGMRVRGSFTLGWDHDDPGSFEALVRWVEARRLFDVDLRLWTPDPGSSVLRRLAAADRIIHRDPRCWDGAHVVVEPARMSAQTLYRGWVWCQGQLAGLRSIWRRRPRPLAELPAYLAAVLWSKLAPLRARSRVRGRLLPALGGEG